MESIQEIKNRIKGRRNQDSQTSVSYIAKEKSVVKPLRRRRGGKFFRGICAIMVLLSFTLGGLIYMRKDEEGTFLAKMFNVNINFSQINNKIGNFLDQTLNFDIFNTGGSVPVVEEQIYVQVGGNYYSSGGNAVFSVGAGVVVFAGQINGNYTVIIEHDKGYTATYSGMEDILVSKMDRVTYKDIIGAVNQNVSIIFSKNGQKITYEEVLEFSK